MSIACCTQDISISAPLCIICAGSGEDVFGKDGWGDTAWEDTAGCGGEHWLDKMMIRQRQQGRDLHRCAGVVYQATSENLGTTACGAQVDVIVKRYIAFSSFIRVMTLLGMNAAVVSTLLALRFPPQKYLVLLKRLPPLGALA
jgi:hypothetical protein